MPPCNRDFATGVLDSSSLLLLCLCGLAHAGDWPRFRGPNGTGIAADKDVPVKWTADEHPVEDRHPRYRPFLADRAGRPRFLAIGLGGRQGTLADLPSTPPREKFFGKRRRPAANAKKHPLNSLASSTPATDGERVYAVFWDGKDIHLGAFDSRTASPSGRKISAGSRASTASAIRPCVIDDKVVLANDQDGSAHLLAFDARSGKKAWEVQRKPFRTCYSTPIIHVRPDGEQGTDRRQHGRNHRLQSGRRQAELVVHLVVPRQAAANRGVADPASGMVVANSGDGDGGRDTIAVKFGDKGDVTADEPGLAEDARATVPMCRACWRSGEHVFNVPDKGMATCHVARTRRGSVERTPEHAGFTASPMMVDGKVYAIANEWLGVCVRGGAEIQAVGEKHGRRAGFVHAGRGR